MNGTSWKIALAVMSFIGTLIFIAPHTSAQAPRARALCASAKMAALQALQSSDDADYRRWQVEVKESCLAAVKR